jgi:hypothetical protein
MTRTTLSLNDFDLRDQPAMLGGLSQLTAWLAPVSIETTSQVSTPPTFTLNTQLGGLLSVNVAANANKAPALVNTVADIVQEVVTPVMTLVEDVADFVSELPNVSELISPAPVSPPPSTPPVNPTPVSPPPSSTPTPPVSPSPATGGDTSGPSPVMSDPAPPPPITAIIPPFVNPASPVAVTFPEVSVLPAILPVNVLNPVGFETDVVTNPFVGETSNPEPTVNALLTNNADQQVPASTTSSTVVETSVPKVATPTGTQEAPASKILQAESIPTTGNSVGQPTIETADTTNPSNDGLADLAGSEFDLFPESSVPNNDLPTSFSETPLDSLHLSGVSSSDSQLGFFASFDNIALGAASYRDDAVASTTDEPAIPTVQLPTTLTEKLRELAYSVDAGELFDQFLLQDVTGLQQDIDAYLSSLQDSLPDIDASSTLRWLLYGLAGGAAFYVGQQKSKRSVFARLRPRANSHDDEFVQGGSSSS